ncbi:MAG: glutamyl-tRNA reductase [Bryobacteraceae bacterium]
MRLAITGLNHTTAPVEVRERLAFKADLLPRWLEDLNNTPGVAEAMVLSTCNRVEVTLAADDSCDPEQTAAGFLARSQQVDESWLRPYLYTFHDRDAIRHLFRVAASLDSMIVGEPQILGQMKDAYEAARAAGCVNGFLDSVITRAFSVAKRVRTETEIGQNAVSVSYAAVELARQIFGSLSGSKVFLIGAGKMSELAARHLERAGVGEIVVTNRSPERARAMAELFRGRIVDYQSFTTHLHEMDVVIASSGAPHYILTRDQMKKVMSARRNRPMFLIDIAVPRNIEPAAADLGGVFLYDIDDLQKVVESNVANRQSEAGEAEKIVAGEVDRMVARLKARELTPTIVGLQQYLENVRAAELGRMRGRLGALTPQQEEALESLTKAMMNKIAHAPIAELRRQAASETNHHFLDAIRRIFHITELEPK